MMPIYFTSDGYKLAGNLFMTADDVKPQNIAFLFIQGWAGNQNVAAAQKLADLGFAAMTYDMRGNKDSEGDITTFTRADFIADVVVAYDFFKQQLPENTKIGVVGSSFGSYTAVLLTEKRPVYCLSLRVPASYPDEGFATISFAADREDNDFRTWRRQVLDFTQNVAFSALHNFTGSIQVIAAELDAEVPLQAPENYAAAVADQSRLSFTIMKDAPHTLATPELNAEYQALLTSWVQKLES